MCTDSINIKIKTLTNKSKNSLFKFFDWLNVG